jgi:hypothetical protein
VTTEAAAIHLVGPRNLDPSVGDFQFPTIHRQQAKPASPYPPAVASLEEAIAFFRRGSLGFSPSGVSERLIGVRLVSDSWDARPVTVDHIVSTMFDNTSVFPNGSCTLDSTLVMRNLPVRWRNEGTLGARSDARAA